MELIFSYHTAQYFCQKHSFPKGKSEEKKKQNRVWSLKYFWSVINSLHLKPKLFHKAGHKFQSRKYMYHFSCAANYPAQTFQ